MSPFQRPPTTQPWPRRFPQDYSETFLFLPAARHVLDRITISTIETGCERYVCREAKDEAQGRSTLTEPSERERERDQRLSHFYLRFSSCRAPNGTFRFLLEAIHQHKEIFVSSLAILISIGFYFLKDLPAVTIVKEICLVLFIGNVYPQVPTHSKSYILFSKNVRIRVPPLDDSFRSSFSSSLHGRRGTFIFVDFPLPKELVLSAQVESKT